MDEVGVRDNNYIAMDALVTFHKVGPRTWTLDLDLGPGPQPIRCPQKPGKGTEGPQMVGAYERSRENIG
jgi:hypothetical protein